MDLVEFGEAFKNLSTMQVSIIRHLSKNKTYIGGVSELMRKCGSWSQSNSTFKASIVELLNAGILIDTHEKYNASERVVSIELPDNWAGLLVRNSARMRRYASGRKKKDESNSRKMVFESPDGVTFMANSITEFVEAHPDIFANSNSARTSFCSRGQYAGWKCVSGNEYSG